MIWLQALWGRVWPYIATVGAALAAVLAIRQSGKAAGRAEAERTKLEAQVRAGEKSREAAAEIESLDDAAVRDRARQRMRKSAR